MADATDTETLDQLAIRKIIEAAEETYMEMLHAMEAQCWYVARDRAWEVRDYLIRSGADAIDVLGGISRANVFLVCSLVTDLAKERNA